MARRCVMMYFENETDRQAIAFYNVPAGAPFSDGWLYALRMEWLDALDDLAIPEASPCQSYVNCTGIDITDDYYAIYGAHSPYSAMTCSPRFAWVWGAK